MKRKVSYAQSEALAKGHAVARRNQRARMAAQDAERRAQEDRDRAMKEHKERGFHGWKNWEYSDDYKTETRTCRVCGKTETRKVRL